MVPGPVDVEAAARRIAPYVLRTPVITSTHLDQWCGASVFAKGEHLQRVGAFKYRGATNAVLRLDAATAAAGVAAHSSGNHAAALALAARTRGIAAHIVMPSTASEVKRSAVLGYGALVTDCVPTEAARIATLRDVCERTGAVEVHPFDNDDVIAGAGTAALELLYDVPALDAIVVPVGGGGLLSGTCLAVQAVAPHVQVYGAEPTGADDAFQSLVAGVIVPSISPTTICDGLLTSLAPRTFTIIQRNVSEIIRVDDTLTSEALALVWTRTKQLVEPSSAIAVAAVRQHPELRGKRVGVILSGGNVDPTRLSALVAR